MKNHIEIGYVKKPKGLKGEVFVVLYDNDSSFLCVGQRLELDGSHALTIKSIKAYKEGFLFTFEGVGNRHQSDPLKGKKIYISSELAESLNNKEEVFLATLLGYIFYNSNQKMGRVSGFSTTKAHDLLQIQLDEGEIVEVPWVEEFLNKIDHPSRSIHFNVSVELLNPEFLGSGKKKKT